MYPNFPICILEVSRNPARCIARACGPAGTSHDQDDTRVKNRRKVHNTAYQPPRARVQSPAHRAPCTVHRNGATDRPRPRPRCAKRGDRHRVPDAGSGRTTATTRWAGCRAESTPTCASVNHKAGTDLLHSTQTATTTSRGHLSSTRTEAQSRPHATRRVQLLHAH